MRVQRSRGTRAMSSASTSSGSLPSVEPQPVRDPKDMGVDRDAFVDAEGVAQHDVRGLSADPGKADHGRDGPRQLAPMLLDETAREADDALRLRAEETGRADDVLDLGAARHRPGFPRWGIARRAAGVTQVDALVGALGGEDGGHGQLEGVAILEGATALPGGLAPGGRGSRPAQPARTGLDGEPFGLDPLRAARARFGRRGPSSWRPWERGL